MLPLPPFQLHTPTTLPAALELLERYGAQAALVAGGTDLLPNMKQGLAAPGHRVSLRAVPGLDEVRHQPGVLRIGAMTSLAAVAAHPEVRAGARALAEAAQAVGGPHHRRMGTLGGNLCLDTRCRYYNQTHFWRQALGYCLKKDGTECHVVQGGKRCVAAASNDTATALIALSGTLSLVGPAGSREVPAREFYTADGLKNTVLGSGEILVSVSVPLAPGHSSAYEKLRQRGAIDFPLLSVAARVDVIESRVASLSLVVSALAARPRRVARTEALAVGKLPEEVSVAQIAEAARRECNPLANIEGDAPWRKEMVAVLARRALTRAGLGGAS